MSSFLLSVIIPIYNAENYLEKCLDSVINQSYKKLEIILINDGSTDNSGVICDEYLKNDKRIQVYHRKNHGLVETRKFGLKKSQGEFVTFVDSDDWIDFDMYEEMLNKIDEKIPDIISSGIIFEPFGNTEIDIPSEGYYEKDEIQNKILPYMMFDRRKKRRGITGSVCNKIFSKKLLGDFIYTINQEITYGEDALITYPAFVKVERVIILNQAWYHYRVNENSMTHIYTENSFRNINVLKNELEKVFTELGVYEEMVRQLEQYIQLFLVPAFEKIYKMKFQQLQYFFPYEEIPKGSRIIIYGAGTVGKSYRNCIYNSNYVNLIAWIDKSYYKFNKQGYMDVDDPQKIININFEYILIAIDNEKIALDIKNWLLDIGIDEGKIIWVKPRKVELLY